MHYFTFKKKETTTPTLRIKYPKFMLFVFKKTPIAAIKQAKDIKNEF